MNKIILVRELNRLDRGALERHFVSLGAEDRRLRFGAPLADSSILAYVARIDYEHDAAFGVFDDALQLAGAAHLARDTDHAELGVSVLAASRRKGLGGALLARAHLHARNWGLRKLFMHCLTENATMMHLARREGMAIVAAQGEADAWLQLPPADAGTHFGALFEERVALFDYALKAQLVQARRLAEALTPGTASPTREK